MRLQPLLAYICWVFTQVNACPEVRLRAILSQRLGISGYLGCPWIQNSGDTNDLELVGALTTG